MTTRKSPPDAAETAHAETASAEDPHVGVMPDEPTLPGPVMPPPDGFAEDAVGRGLALVLAEEALAALDDEPTADQGAIEDEETMEESFDDRDSGVFELLDDGPPTLRFIRSY